MLVMGLVMFGIGLVMFGLGLVMFGKGDRLCINTTYYIHTRVNAIIIHHQLLLGWAGWCNKGWTLNDGSVLCIEGDDGAKFVTNDVFAQRCFPKN